ncbi:hypothetical protein Ddye_000319 [Dipteronia dyeriana]|uniref:SWIM-type domain-containing protein n=1 Tax=Dipteronia dyeriana TaxID=168575 RepID=A0AAD9XM41_9ROSI|nr:hypothetical protein Ddye_000319 [Dipteronia dyeriana]
MPNTNAHLDDIRGGFTETVNNDNSPHRHFGFHDTTKNENVSVHEVSEPQFDSISDQVPICYDDQFTHIQRLVPPPSASYSINFGKVASRPVDMCIAVGELFEMCINGNDQIFPLAFGVGDSETNEAWEWFLTRLHRAVVEVDDLVIVSDRKNSIIIGVEKVFPKSFHGACAVYLERNMLGRYGKNKILKDIFRKAVKVYRVNQFMRCMEQLANINSEAAMYITDVGFERWARAYSPWKRYNLMSSNIAEAMNNAIKVCRELPITEVIDCIRGVLQRWFYVCRTFAGKLKSTLTTKVDVSICVKDEKASYLTVYPITYYSFLVKDGDLDGTVDLTSKTCTCREFDMDGLPCEHALACIREIHPVGHLITLVYFLLQHTVGKFIQLDTHLNGWFQKILHQ